jgi:hypothetical protein
MTIAIMTTAEILSANRVTTEQVAAVTFKNRGAEVESASGNGTYYVRRNLDRNILVCCCPASEVGRKCWHIRATVAKLQLLAVEKREQAAREQAAIEDVFNYARRAR